MARNTAEATAMDFNRIVVGTKIQGEIETQGDIRIDGTVIGKLNVQGKLVLGEKGIIEGELICKFAEILGTVNGELAVSDWLSLKSTAVIKGDIITLESYLRDGINLF